MQSTLNLDPSEYLIPTMTITASPASVASMVDAANTISEFLAYEQLKSISDLRSIVFKPLDAIGNGPTPASALENIHVIVLCASAVLSTADTVLSTLNELVASASMYIQSHTVLPSFSNRFRHLFI